MFVEKGTWIWMDGGFVPWDEAQVHVLTHTLHYGLGVFEGIRCYKQEDGSTAIFRLEEHNRRLFDSAPILGLKIPFEQREIFDACLETVTRNELVEGYLRPLVFNGEGEMGLGVVNQVRLSISCWPWGAYLGPEAAKQGIRVKTSSFARIHSNTFMSKSKAVGVYVNSILAAHEAHAAGYDEALLLDTEGFAAEGPGENLFMVRDGIVRTPASHSILPGITRDTVIRLLREEGYEVQEDRITRDEIYVADEAFYCGTAAEVATIRELDDRQIGIGTRGPITELVQNRYEAVVRGGAGSRSEWLTPISRRG